MNALLFAWRSLVRQPARAVLGVVGVAAVGALLFDMLLLSNGLVLSLQQVLASTGFDIRVGTGAGIPGTGAAIPDATSLAAALRAVPGVDHAVPLMSQDGEILRPRRSPIPVNVIGAGTIGRSAWTIVSGRDLSDGGTGDAVVSRTLANALQVKPGDELPLRAFCTSRQSVAPPLRLRFVGVADFPFDNRNDSIVGTSLADLDRACGGTGRDFADIVLVATSPDSETEAVRASIERLRPDLKAFSNDQFVERLQQGGLSYFRQISLVLITVTIAFAFLLVTVLLSVSVNQRTGEIAALRALGFSRRRVVADVLCESGLLVGAGGLVALPLGLALARVLDGILKGIPGIPPTIHFFVFQPAAVAIHLALFAATAVLAAAYPMRMVAHLPIAATLRREVVS